MHKTILLGAVLSLLMSVAAPSFAAKYSIIGLGTLGGGTLSEGRGINNAGQVVGHSRTAAGVYRAFIFSDGAMQDLGTLGGTESFGFGINNTGQVVGTSQTAGGGWRAFLYSNGAMQDLGIFDDGTASYGQSINDAGQIVGSADTAGGRRAFLYSNGAMQDLGTLGGTFSEGTGINNAGQVVGISNTTGNFALHAFLYGNGVMQDLGTLDGRSGSGSSGINNAGQVVGTSYTAGNAYSPFLFSNGVMQDLGTLGGTWGIGHAINDDGQVVGAANADGDAASRAFLYSNGVMQDLNALIPANSGWFLAQAFGINDLGQITGVGVFNGQQQAFLATPVPLPGAVWLLLTGLAGLGATGRARSGLRKSVPSTPLNGRKNFSWRGTADLAENDRKPLISVVTESATQSFVGATLKIFAASLMITYSMTASAIPITYSVGSRTDVFGADAVHSGSTVSLNGLTGIVDISQDYFSKVELVVGQFSLNTSNPLNRNLPYGFNAFPYAIDLEIGGIKNSILHTLYFNRDHSNDSFYLQGAMGTVQFEVRRGLNIEAQFLTSSVPAANAGETTTGDLVAQFYGRPYAIPEPSTTSLLAAALFLGTIMRLFPGEKNLKNHKVPVKTAQ
jgi:probable HAF family extracellular repeat protein